MAELFGAEAGSVGTQMKCLLSPTLDSKAFLDGPKLHEESIRLTKMFTTIETRIVFK